MLSDDKHVMEIKSNCEWSFICGVLGSLFDAFLYLSNAREVWPDTVSFKRKPPVILSTVELTGTWESLRAGQIKKKDSYKMEQTFVPISEKRFQPPVHFV